MSRLVILDAGPLGLASNPQRSPASTACAQWVRRLVLAGVRVPVPEIADYEVRRELLRAKKSKGITHLDALEKGLEYVPITTAAMRQAALFWAQARQQGQPTAGDNTIDSDMILAGQAATLGATNVVIATTNVRHLARLVPADLWSNITP